MNSLEFIRKKISKKIKTINEKRNFMINCKKMNIPFNPEITYEDEKELEYLRQIESELEVWEVVKDNLWVAEHMQENLNIITMYEINKSINKKEFETLLKALEVKENVD